MRTLFVMDSKDYDPDGRALVRPSVRGIILRDGKVAMVHSIKYDYYKFPGGGMDPGESCLDTLVREVLEESGLQVLSQTVQEFGLVPRTEKSDRPEVYDLFVQDNYYYLCQVSDTVCAQKLDDYEEEEHFTLEWVSPEKAIDDNRTHDHGPTEQSMLEREARVLEILRDEGYFR